MREKISKTIQMIVPFDRLEETHIRQTLAWIASGEPLFRIQKPAVPIQHLVSYFALFDPAKRQILLVDHKNAGLWLPAGGHVEPDEDPYITVEREAEEELQIKADFLQPTPLFLTVTQTVGNSDQDLSRHPPQHSIQHGTQHSIQHIDVSLWYVLQYNSTMPLTFDKNEFHAIRWFALDQLPLERCDPHLQRFVDKVVQFNALKI